MPGSSLHQVASWLKDDPIGAALEQKTGFASLHIRPFFPATFSKSIRQLPQEEEGGTVFVAKKNFRAETADALAQLRTRSKSRQHSAGKLPWKTTGTALELIL